MPFDYNQWYVLWTRKQSKIYSNQRVSFTQKHGSLENTILKTNSFDEDDKSGTCSYQGETLNDPACFLKSGFYGAVITIKN